MKQAQLHQSYAYKDLQQEKMGAAGRRRARDMHTSWQIFAELSSRLHPKAYLHHAAVTMTET
jgi:hypothetical protein